MVDTTLHHRRHYGWWSTATHGVAPYTGWITNQCKLNNNSRRSYYRRIIFVFIIIYPILSFIMLSSYTNVLSVSDTTGETEIKVSEEALEQFKQTKSELSNQQLQQQQQQTTQNISNGNKESFRSVKHVTELSCTDYGGPSDEDAAKMIYWEEDGILSDAEYVSPLQHPTIEQYVTFEPYLGGWNNIRMSVETIVAMTIAMGRTLVLPPETDYYASNSSDNGQEHIPNPFTFSTFFNMEHIAKQHPGVKIISMKEFLSKEALTGRMVDTTTRQVSFPPQNNRTNWDNEHDIHSLYLWLRSVSHVPTHWDPNECFAVFPDSRSETDIVQLEEIHDEISLSVPMFEDYIDNPVLINGTVTERMKESWATRKNICIYDKLLQDEKYIHFAVDGSLDTKLLTHFYSFIFFQNYKTDLWMKRFIRNQFRYIDEIQCAAARIVSRIREKAKAYDPIVNPNGTFHALHVRRDDFNYMGTQIDAKELLAMVQRRIPYGSSVYIATDESSKSFFRPLIDRYHIMFLGNFMVSDLNGVDSGFYPLIDTLVASRSEIFYGCWFSTFTGYINRLRGYHANKEKLPGYEQGIINSYYYALSDRFDHMQHYYPIKKQFYAREFPTAWRLIDATF